MVDGGSCPRRGRLFKVHHNTAKDTAMSELLSPRPAATDENTMTETHSDKTAISETATQSGTSIMTPLYKQLVIRSGCL